MKHLTSAGLLTLAAVIATPVHAGSATIETGEGKDRQQVQFEYSKDKLRFQAAQQADGGMIIRDGKAYVLADKTVIELSGMGGMMKQMAGNVPMAGPQGPARFLGLDATGRSETVAGAKGSVHILRYIDDENREQREEVVLSRDARAREFGDAMQLMATTMARAMEQPQTAAEADMRKVFGDQSILRYGQHFRVVAFGADPAAARFELPSAPQQLPSLQGMGLGLGAGASAQTGAEPAAAGDGGVMGKLFGNKAQRQQDRVEQRTEAEVDQTTDQAVDKVLDKAFDKLFNR